MVTKRYEPQPTASERNPRRREPQQRDNFLDLQGGFCIETGRRY